MPHLGPKVDWYDLKKPGKNDREGTEVVTWLRILPQSKDVRKPWWQIVFGHKFEIADPNGGKSKWVRWHCLETLGGDHKCGGTQARIALYQYSNEMKEEKRPKRESDSPIRAQAKKFSSQKGAMFNAIVVAEGRDPAVSATHRHEDESLHPKIIRVPAGLANDLTQLESDRGFVAHPLKGMLIKIIAEKTGPLEQNIEYSVIAQDREPLHKDWWPIFDNLVDLTTLLQVAESEEEEWQNFCKCIPAAVQMYRELSGVIDVPVEPARGESFDTARTAQADDRPPMPSAAGFSEQPYIEVPGSEDDIPF